MRDRKLTARRVLALLCLAAVSGACTPRIVRDGVVETSLAAAIEERTARVRHLPFLRPVPIELVGEDQVRRYVLRKMEEEMPAEKQKGIVKAYSKLGLLPAGFDYEAVVLGLYLDQIAGYYEPDEKKLFVVQADLPGGFLVSLAEWAARRDLRGELVLSHELTHALQDQHFDLDPFLDFKGSEDARMARQAVAEGDAMIAALLDILDTDDPGALSGLDLDEMSGLVAEESSMEEVPPVLVETLVFPYLGGMKLVLEALDRGGWNAVDAMYADPPASTEQILHLEKYFRAGGERDGPLPVAKPAPGKWLEGWREIESEVEGELVCKVFFEQFVGAEVARLASEGWGGDRFVALEGPAGEVAFFWRSRWDSAGEAGEFASAFGAVVGKKYPGASLITQTRDPFEVWTTAGKDLVFLERRGDEVMAAEGLPAAWSAGEARERAWSAE